MQSITSASAQSATAPNTEAFKAMMHAVDIASTAWEEFDNLSGLFAAIESLSDKHSTIRKLASTGRYIADEMANLNDGQREQCQGRLDFLKCAASGEGLGA